MAQEWIELHEDRDLHVGDRIRVWAQVVGMAGVHVSSVQVDWIVREIDKDPRFRVLAHSWPDAENKFNIRIEVVKNPLPAAVAIAAVTGIILAAIGAMMVFKFEILVDKTIELTETAGEEARATLGTAAAAVGIVVGLLILHKYTKRR